MAADNSFITVNLSDDPRLKYNNTIIKRKALVRWWGTQSDKEIRLALTIRYYANNGGNYGVDAISGINADNALSDSQKAWQRQTFADRQLEYSTQGSWVDTNGNPVAEGTPGAITELEYWQGFTLAQVPGITSTSVGAFAGVYLIATAMIQRLDTLKMLG